MAPTKETAVTDLTAVSLDAFVSESGNVGMISPDALQEDRIELVSDSWEEKFRAAVIKRDAVCILLAAGQGSRFKSDVPKVIHPLCGKPLAQHAIDAAYASGLPVVIVVGHARDQVARALNVRDDHAVAFVCQHEQMGTGHAVYVAMKGALPPSFTGDIVVAYADNPGIDGQLMKRFVEAHDKFKDTHGEAYAAMAVTGSRKCAGQGAINYGRIVRQSKPAQGPVVDIVEKKTIAKMMDSNENKSYSAVEWTPKELEDIDEFNSGIVIAKAAPYRDVLAEVTASQTKTVPMAKFEYYATDFVKGLVSKGLIAEGFQVEESEMWKLEGSNTVDELMELKVKMEAFNNNSKQA